MPTILHDYAGQPVSMEAKYFCVVAQERKPNRKTRDYSIISNLGDTLGLIKWYAAWRRYTFLPAADTIWSDDCLEHVQAFIRRLMDARKKEK